MTTSSNSRPRYFAACYLGTLLAIAPPLLAKTAMPGGKLLKCAVLPCIEIRLADGKRLTMLMDTGNVNSVLDASKAAQLKLAVSPVNGADGKPLAGYSVATLKNAYAGDASLGDVKVLVMDLNSDIEKGTFPQADGTLAYTALKEKLLVLDYVRRSYAIAPAPKEGLSCGSRCGLISNPTFGQQGPPILATTGFTLNGTALTMQIDTLWTGTMLLYDDGPAKLSLQALSLARPTLTMRKFPYTDGGVQMLEVPSKFQSFQGTILNHNAPFYSPTPGVHQPDGLFDGTVGNELFNHHRLEIDFASNQFLIT